MSAEWPSVESHNVSLPTIVTTSDLFDGELFGDELMDIYNNAGVDENGDPNEIPTLLDHGVHSHHDDELHPINIGGLSSTAMDDGLGAFRPSTSFNDLSTLLAAEANAAAQSITPVASAPATTIPDSSPAAKRKASLTKAAPKRADPTPTVTTTVSQVPTEVACIPERNTIPSTVQKKAAADDTPNPLFLVEKAAEKLQVTESVVSSTGINTLGVQPHIVSVSMSSSDSSIAESEADFKTIAQAAVSNLIMSAGTTKVESGKSDFASAEKVDTSTAHIKALTGNNWVTACTGAASNVVPVAPVHDPKNSNRSRRQNLTPDERARQNRDRNREHARNTRLRKKAYVEELKHTLTELVAQRDAADLEKRQAVQREAEQREVRFRVIEEFLKLRGRNEGNVARWSAILEEGFFLKLPVTAFRSMVKDARTTDFEQELNGVCEVMADSSNLASFLQGFDKDSIGDISLHYECDRANFLMDGCNAVLEWTAKTSKKGETSGFSLKGSMRGIFSPASNKLISASISFDTGSVQSQLHQLLRESGHHTPFDAAEMAASQADAILDSLQMPQMSMTVPSAVNVVPNSSSSSSDASSNKDDSLSSDESLSEAGHKSGEQGIPSRRVRRVA
ncbi:predicted protein [Phaeodactylum tricornutum CCAP 1055/1]|uniref:BZIP domain-containing protein n=2 Tax=Phaeodactylum tricornutum TaxID=2850 RepID=B7FNT6_PHATC|nr:predicted protein [Phaeodactylum tricornutum CCAP 1055/1]EEC51055.1 predicted protein [Phaeodactylum tricornutum CCAP 1055/1]|eukprot:XP_002176592.1 predicted protein [Phaeodactylum tricornutum CCAP 1055/1]